VETETALVRTDCRVVLNSVTAVYLNVTLVVNPGYSELNESLGLDHAADDICVNKILTALNNGLEGLENLVNSLKKFGLVCIARTGLRVNFV
jgi:hypothetical protein